MPVYTDKLVALGNTNILTLLELQTRAARVILDLDTSARSVDMFKQLNWIPYYNEVKIHT